MEVSIQFVLIVWIWSPCLGHPQEDAPIGRTRTQAQSSFEEDGSLVTFRQVPQRQEMPPDRPRSQGVSREALRERLDSVLLLLSRLGDRIVAMETNQKQDSERIDNINYRITKLDLQENELKSQFTDAWTTFRHRLEVTNREMERITSILDTIKSEVTDTNSKAIEINTKIESIKHAEAQSLEKGRAGPKLQSILVAVFGVKSNTQAIQSNVDEISQNLTDLNNSTRRLEELSMNLVTKQDLNLGLASVREEFYGQRMSFVSIPSSTKEGRSKKESADCWELFYKRGKTKSGVYRIHPPFAQTPFFVYCDMEIDGGGWTVLQRREDGTVDFLRDWHDYKQGFGNLAGEFWLGNEKIYQITNHQVNELRIDLSDFSQTTKTSSYTAFAIGPESQGYALALLSEYSGTAGDSLSYHVGQKWSTFDFDNDEWPDMNCARDHTGAWWYKSCDTSNLNGRYLHGPVPPGEEYKGIYWYDFHGPQYSLWRTSMMIRRGGYVSRKNTTVPSHIKHSPNIPHPLERQSNPDEDPLYDFQ